MLNKIYIKKLEKEYFIGNVIGDSNCVFYSLSNLIFRKINFYPIIRQNICNYMEEKSEFDDFLQNKDKYISRMRNDKIYERRNEIYFFSIMCGIQIKYFVLTIYSSKCYKTKKDEINLQIINGKGKGNFGVLLGRNKKNEKVNNFSPIVYKKDNGVSDEELLRIKKIICGINPDSNRRGSAARFRQVRLLLSRLLRRLI